MEWLLALWDLFTHLDAHLMELVRQYGLWVYGILFLVIFAETGLVVTPFLPGDSLLFIIGAFAANGIFDPWLIVGLLLSAAVLGDNCNYFIGRFLGKKLFANPQSRIFRKDYLDQTHAFFEKHGGKTLVVARFVPIVRTFAPFVAGMGEMHYFRFLAFSIGGGLFWVGSLTLAGFWLGNLPWVKDNLTVLIFGIIGLSLMPVILQAFKFRQKAA
jgi:membrane-associated protein